MSVPGYLEECEFKILFFSCFMCFFQLHYFMALLIDDHIVYIFQSNCRGYLISNKEKFLLEVIWSSPMKSCNPVM
jgi:hypothetical protein